MLSQKSAATVRATLPVVAEAIGTVSDVFYRRMFTAHPELLRNLFNRANQASGTQARALAGSVAAYATALVTPGKDADGMLRRIAHKHASLGVAPAQYDVVHEHLFGALGEVLGDAATDEVVAAWDEVYWRMARTLIDSERALYARHGVLTGATWRQWEVVERIQETPEAVTFRIRPADGRAAPHFSAGQYISVQAELPDGARQIRQYSLTGVPGDPVHSFTVKRELPEGGVAGEVSHQLHDQVREGCTLTVSAPYGDLVLETEAAEDTETALLFASAGIGCTPFHSMLHHLVAQGHQGSVLALHADRSPATHALRAERERLVTKLAEARSYVWYEHADEPAADSADDSAAEWRTGRMDLSGLELPERVRAYLCGPLPFMRGVRDQLLARGVPAGDIHYEVFGPDLWLAR
ncbi:globin domain-containing protein [Streptomyces iconiensis]|uniref:nitric oxide dioxygenase n=1 Tax=Streptomyces iconiensis TaxID=1384038 RepID=A0ABT6ZUD9_9ACTN|nr:globin domain-containing protein [Streptomyces iconiensis]MDJ1132674.1 globin domain-containing protein [Streptomyces iconiensis]